MYHKPIDNIYTIHNLFCKYFVAKSSHIECITALDCRYKLLATFILLRIKTKILLKDY